MDNLARKRDFGSAFQECGVISESEESYFAVETNSGTWKAKQATSCLIQPLVGDKVLVSVDPSNGCYVLAILERQKGKTYSLAFDSDVELKVSNGRFTLASQEGLDLASAKDVNLVSSDLKVYSTRGEVGVDRLFFLGSFLQAQLERISLIAGVFDSVLERLSQKVKWSYRTIEESEHVKAGGLHYVAKKLLSLRGKYSMITAKKDVKIDGERIHMG